MVRKGMLLQLLDELRTLEENGSEFTAREVAESVGYSVNSVNKYFNEKLKGKYVTKVSRSLWKCSGITQLSNDQFFLLMSQSQNTQALLIKSAKGRIYPTELTC
ncbi:hypothetical protein L1D55_08955 [Vibrio sp. Isolate22]|uniref:hypothetical protein n=1 Tax=Vibrio sp. Isolate22 TaxID=2908532 RepID=UPI001EFE7724|nr:hypothetical protein [Vibrio sp. Isolate22]MCG9691877.1 hypothetical protein [Vibrio sp. Isolate22]